MEAWSDKISFTNGWSKMFEDLALDTRSTFIFTMAGYETFEVSVFNHQTGTEIYFKKVEVVVLDDPTYGDEGFDLLLASEHKEKLITNESDLDGDFAGDVVGDSMQLSTFESIFNDIDDSKFDQHIAALIEMEDVKKQFKDDWNTKTEVFNESSSDAYRSHVDSKGKLKVVVGDKGLSTTVKTKFEMDIDNFLIPKNKLHVEPKGKSNAVVCYQNLS